MKRPRKYTYMLVLQGHYGPHGWEDLCAEERSKQGRREIRERRREYSENEGGTYRVIGRRELRATS